MKKNDLQFGILYALLVFAFSFTASFITMSLSSMLGNEFVSSETGLYIPAIIAYSSILLALYAAVVVFKWAFRGAYSPKMLLIASVVIAVANVLRLLVIFFSSPFGEYGESLTDWLISFLMSVPISLAFFAVSMLFFERLTFFLPVKKKSK